MARVSLVPGGEGKRMASMSLSGSVRGGDEGGGLPSGSSSLMEIDPSAVMKVLPASFPACDWPVAKVAAHSPEGREEIDGGGLLLPAHSLTTCVMASSGA